MTKINDEARRNTEAALRRIHGQGASPPKAKPPDLEQVRADNAANRRTLTPEAKLAPPAPRPKKPAGRRGDR